MPKHHSTSAILPATPLPEHFASVARQRMDRTIITSRWWLEGGGKVNSGFVHTVCGAVHTTRKQSLSQSRGGSSIAMARQKRISSAAGHQRARPASLNGYYYFVQFELASWLGAAVVVVALAGQSPSHASSSQPGLTHSWRSLKGCL